jgi:hypothetical protein
MIASIFFIQNGLRWTKTRCEDLVSRFIKHEMCQIHATIDAKCEFCRPRATGRFFAPSALPGASLAANLASQGSQRFA